MSESNQSSARGFQSWPIVRTKPIGKTHGRSISVFINNMQSHLTTVDVYEDGSIDCWGFVDRQLFATKLQANWVVPNPKPNQMISVHGFGGTRVSDGRWFQTTHSIATEAESIIHTLNPGMLNLIDMQGAATEPRGKVQYAKMGIADKKAYRLDKVTGQEIVADSVPVLRVERDTFEVTRLFIYADGVFEIGGSGELLPLCDLPSLYEQDKIANVAPAESLLIFPGLGGCRTVDQFGGVGVDDRVREVNDKFSVLNGRPSLIAVCINSFAEYKREQSPEAKDALREAYLAVPEHLRGYCGDMDTRDSAIRAALYPKT